MFKWTMPALVLVLLLNTGVFAGPMMGCGAAPSSPCLPQSTQDLPGAVRFTFTNPDSGLWFAPLYASSLLVTGFELEVKGNATFDEVEVPLGFGPISVVVGGMTLAMLGPGGEFFFPSGVKVFSLLGISPAVDVGGPNFPVQLDWTGQEGNLTFFTVGPTVPPVTNVPEPATLLLLGSGLVGLALRRRWQTN